MMLLRDIRCPKGCSGVLAKNFLGEQVEIKCPKCGLITKIAVEAKEKEMVSDRLHH